MRFAPIHNHSEFSSLDGLSTCREIAQRCLDIGCECCGISDHGTVAGHLEFAKVMAEMGLKPVFACELYHGVKTEFERQERDQAHFIAGALTDEGLRNLWRMVDAASTNFRFVGRINWEIAEKYKEGVFATSACIQGLVSQQVREGEFNALNRYLDIYKDNFYVELHTYPGTEHEALNIALVQTATERGVPVVYATDAHFATPEQYEVHDTYVAMQTGENIYVPIEERKMWHPKSLYIQDEQQIRASLSYLPESVVDEALRNTAELADRCNASLPEVRRHLPKFSPKACPWTEDELGYVPDDAAIMLLDLVEAGIDRRYGDNTEAWDRARRELEVFLDGGLEHYFLQTWDFCTFCDRDGIQRGPGRGSAAGSIVAYALGITDVDPIHYDLIFERFYNPGRAKGFPDIDNDFPKADRKRVRQYLMDRWGHDKVRAIGTVTRLKPKAACDRTFNACGVTFQEKEELKKLIDLIPDLDILGSDSIGWDRDIDPGKTIYVMDHVGERIINWLGTKSDDRLSVLLHWVDVLRVVCSRVSGYGVHPSGTVVAEVSLDAELPCTLRGPKGDRVQATCFAMSDVDLRQFVKQDLLGLRNLDTLQEWERLRGESMNWSGLDRQQWPEEMWRMLDEGFTLGIFQIEEGYGKRLCKDFRPRSVEDLGIIVALNRPGPIRSGAPDSFIRRRNGLEDVVYDHPFLEDILDRTYGWFLYQEQVIAFFEKLGLSKSDADAVRKILGKKKPEEMQALGEGKGEWQGKGYFALAEQAGIDRASAEVIWNNIQEFAKYSFNKSHAIAYAIIAFRTLYAKWVDPQNFIIASIKTIGDDPNKQRKTSGYVGEGRRLGFDVLPPDILRSQVDIAVVDGDVLFGFYNVKGVGVGASRYVIECREENDISSPELLDEVLNLNQHAWESVRDQRKLEGISFKQKSPRQTLRSNQITALYEVGAWDPYDERGAGLAAIQKSQKDLLGVILTDDCAETFAANQNVLDGCDAYSELLVCDSGEYLKLPGAIASVTPKITKAGKKMGIVTIEFEGEAAEFVVFPQQWTSYKFLWKERTPGVFTIKCSDRGWSFDSGVKL